MRRFFFKEWRANLRARPLLTFLIVLVAGAGLASVSAIRAELTGAQQWWNDRFALPLMEIYLDNSFPGDSITAFTESLEALPQIQSVEFVSAAEAQADAEEYLGAIAFSVLPANPLPSSIRLTFAPEFRTPEEAQHLADSLVMRSGVTDIMAAHGQMAVYVRGRDVITGYANLLLTAALGWLIFWLFIGLHVIMRVRSPHWRIWTYLGARPGWFRWPPMAEGLVLGLLSSVCAWLIGRFLIEAEWASLTKLVVNHRELIAFWTIPAIIGAASGWLAYRVNRPRGVKI